MSDGYQPRYRTQAEADAADRSRDAITKVLARGAIVAALALLDLGIMRFLIWTGWSFEWAFAAAVFIAIAVLQTREAKS